MVTKHLPFKCISFFYPDKFLIFSQIFDFMISRLSPNVDRVFDVPTGLGVEKYYNSTNPFDFMEMISLQGKTNFFEKRVGEYANRSNPNVDKTENQIDFDTDF